ncbi:MAG: glycosyltransferase family 2 protein [Stagnimonas sp.]|nr:glycosyltransferase family 2 protein [Stagnimonas sp.]
MLTLSVILPARNEAVSLATLLPALRASMPQAEIIVVDDGSTDNTSAIAASQGAKVVRHTVSRGNGAAIKSGARAATGDVLVMMDADGQHQPEDIAKLLQKIEEGFDLVVGTRSASAHANIARRLANGLYNRLASWLTGQAILDLTSGFRAVRRAAFLPFLPLLPNKFSYPTTSTMCLIRAGYGVHFEPVNVLARTAGTASHIQPLRDGGRFVLIIIKIATLYSPLKIFGAVAASLFATGAWYYAYTFITEGRFTNAGALLFTTAVLTFLMGLVSEQITQLLYMNIEREQQDR